MDDIIFAIPNKSDFEEVRQYSSSDMVTKYLTWENYKSIEDFRKFFENSYLKKVVFPNLFRKILVNGNFVGTLHMLTREEGVIQIGFGLLPQFWGHGIGKSIFNKICEFISETYSSIEIIRADVNVNNIAMIKILESYGFVKMRGLDGGRFSYEYKADILRFKCLLFSNNDVEGLFEVGNLQQTPLSDFDYIISFYEESRINNFVKEMDNIGFLVIDNPAPYHYFFESRFGEIFDVYLIASSFFHAILNVQNTIFDKSGFLSSKLNVKEKQYFSVCYEEKYLYFLIKIFDKFSKNKFIQIERIMESLRDSVIIPLARETGEAAVDDITSIHWKNEDNLYLAYKAMMLSLNLRVTIV